MKHSTQSLWAHGAVAELPVSHVSEPRRRSYVSFLASLVVLSVCLPLRGAEAERQTINLLVDTSDIARKIFHSTFSIPVQPGPLTLVYPKWYYNVPSGLPNRIIFLEFSAAGRRLAWTRDSIDMFAFHLKVPPGVGTVEVEMRVVAASQPEDPLGAATTQLFVLEWQQVLLYPATAASDQLRVRARIRLPKDWDFGCALTGSKLADGSTEFSETTLATLADSPLLAGKYFRHLELEAGSAPPTVLDVAGETMDATVVPQKWQQRFTRLRAEAGTLFGGFPHPDYHFLIGLSDELGDDGLEHARCCDLRLSVRLFSDESYRLAYAYLVPHEYTHSWNGIYRRPAGVAQRNLQDPQSGELLWVYEGLTRYLNWVLAARCGIFSLEEARDYTAFLAAKMDHRTGREWRSLQDTATAAQHLYFASSRWQSFRREVDFYDESLLIWLEVDATIRHLTNGQCSLDDFCRAFYQPPSRNPGFEPYIFNDIVAALNGIVRHDWAKFFEERLNFVGSDRAPLDGLAASGWTLAYRDVPGSVQAARDNVNHTVEERFSIGMLLQEDGTITDVVGQSASWNAGLGPGMKIVTVNALPWSAEVLRRAIERDVNEPIKLRVKNGSVMFEAMVMSHVGKQYPCLVRNLNPDLMTAILLPRTIPETSVPGRQ